AGVDPRVTAGAGAGVTGARVAAGVVAAACALLCGGSAFAAPGDGGPATKVPIPEAAKPFGGLATDTEGNLYIGENGAHLVRKVDRGGTLSTVAGNGTPGTKGDGGPATAAQLAELKGLAV